MATIQRFCHFFAWRHHHHHQHCLQTKHWQYFFHQQCFVNVLRESGQVKIWANLKKETFSPLCILKPKRETYLANHLSFFVPHPVSLKTLKLKCKQFDILCRNANVHDFNLDWSPYATRPPCPASVGFARLEVNIWVLNLHFREATNVALAWADWKPQKVGSLKLEHQ